MTESTCWTKLYNDMKRTIAKYGSIKIPERLGPNVARTMSVKNNMVTDAKNSQVIAETVVFLGTAINGTRANNPIL